MTANLKEIIVKLFFICFRLLSLLQMYQLMSNTNVH